MKPGPPQVGLRAPTELWGIRLGDKFEAYAASHGPFDKEAARPASVRKQAGDEDFVQRNGQLRVGVRKGLVSSVAYSCKENRDPTAMYKVACHAGPERIKAVFGDRVRAVPQAERRTTRTKTWPPFVRAYDIVEVQTRLHRHQGCDDGVHRIQARRARNAGRDQLGEMPLAADIISLRRRDARVAEGGALLRRYTGLNLYRGFESSLSARMSNKTEPSGSVCIICLSGETPA